MSDGFFITGTDTDVGKTLVSSALLLKLRQQGERVVGMKPVASGCINTSDGLRNADAESLIDCSSTRLAYTLVNPYAFEPAIAPHLAAEQAGQSISLDKICQNYQQLSGQSDRVVVEGVGGWQVPLNEHETMEDLARKLDLPVIMVVGIRLGCINHALLTYQAILASGLDCHAWIANRIDPGMRCFEENISTLRKSLKAPCWGIVPWYKNVDIEAVVDNLIKSHI